MANDNINEEEDKARKLYERFDKFYDNTNYLYPTYVPMSVKGKAILNDIEELLTNKFHQHITEKTLRSAISIVSAQLLNHKLGE